MNPPKNRTGPKQRKDFLEAPIETPPPAIAFFLQHASRLELTVAYKALVGLLMGDGLDVEEAEVSREMYLALQREMERRLHSAIFSSTDAPLPF